jgi:hypothetical protein
MARLNSEPVKMAAVASLDDAANYAREATIEEVYRVYNISPADLAARISRMPVNVQRLMVEVSFSGRSFSLSYFDARQIAVNRIISRRGQSLRSQIAPHSITFRGVVVEVKAGQVTQLKSAFLARMPSGHIGVMERKGRKRYPIREKKVISLASMIQGGNIAPKVIEKVNSRWGVVFPQKLQGLLDKG